SIRKSRKQISDLVAFNDWEHFGTFTFDCQFCPANIEGKKCTNNSEEHCICDSTTCKRYDNDFTKSLMSKWLKLEQRRVGQFSYLIVSERHKCKDCVKSKI